MSTPFRIYNLQKTLDAQNAGTSEIAGNWNVSGTSLLFAGVLRRNAIHERYLRRPEHASEESGAEKYRLPTFDNLE
jgi:hypothetical protein